MRDVIRTTSVVCVFSLWACAATYEVSPTGEDRGPGTAARPFRTIQRAVVAAGPGDTIIVKDGTYGHEGLAHDPRRASQFPVHIGKAGTSAAWITLKAEHKGAAILDCEDVENSHDGCDGYISVGSSAAYWMFEDLVFTRGYWAGMFLSGAHHIAVKGCRFENIGRHVNLLAYGEVGIYAASASHDLVYDGNVFHAIGRTGGAYPKRDHGLYLHGANSVVMNNVFYQPFEGFAVRVASGFSGIIANNTFAFAQHAFDGSQARGHIALCEQTGSITIANNIFLAPYSSGIHVTNSADQYRWGLQPGASCTINANMLYGARDMLDDGTAACTVSGTIVANPLLQNDANVAAFDFHLRPGSPAIGAGRNIPEIVTDFDGNVRQQGAFDIGAHQTRGGIGSRSAVR